MSCASNTERISVSYAGDSNLRRYLIEILQRRPYISSDNQLCCELAIGGQTISQLQKRIRRCNSGKYAYKLQDRITITIGTNDILKGHPYNSIRTSYLRLMNTFKSSNVSIKLITLPPYLYASTVQAKNILKVNKFIKTFESRRVRVVDLYGEMEANPSTFLERDGRHLNRKGLELLHRLL